MFYYLTQMPSSARRTRRFGDAISGCGCFAYTRFAPRGRGGTRCCADACGSVRARDRLVERMNFRRALHAAALRSTASKPAGFDSAARPLWAG